MTYELRPTSYDLKRGYMLVIRGGVTAPKGFFASGIKAGIKKSMRRDLALLYSEVPAIAAAAFTTNRIQASPVKVSKHHLSGKLHQAIIVNSGNANCANGKAGDRDASLMAKYTAEALALDKKETLVASTGIIGKYLPIENIRKHIPGLAGELSEKGSSSFAEAIMTTDTVKKEMALNVKIGNSKIVIGGASKGVGMIYPELAVEKHPSTSLRIVPNKRKRVEGHATMLAFITTDASITKRMLEIALGEAINESFNMISVDGDMSTNDSCFIMANGLAGNKKIESKNKAYYTFLGGLKFLTAELSKKMVKDGEGATKFVQIEVTGAKSYADAKMVGRKVSTSSLLKSCVYGEDPNWGRIAAACGASGVKFNPDRVDIYLGGVKVMLNGASVKNYDREKTRKLFKKDDIYIKVDLKEGKYMAKAWTCDLSLEYVRINAEYST